MTEAALSGLDHRRGKMDPKSERLLEGPLAHHRGIVSLHDPIGREVANAVAAALGSLGGNSASPELSVAAIHRSMVPPPRSELGDFAVPCFTFGKLLKRSPQSVAEQLSKALEGSEIGSFTNAGPYLNVRVRDSLYHQHTLNAAFSGALFQRTLLTSAPVTMFEFSQPNTHKELHVGHMRNLCLGDALARCARYIGVPVITATFPGDVGTHVAKCLWFLKHRNQEPVPQDDRGAWLGAIYSRATKQLDDEESSPTGAENKQCITEILKQLEEQRGEYFDLWKETRTWSIDQLKKAYSWADVQFDRWYWESEVDAPSVEFVRGLKEQGKLTESEGAVGADLTAEGLGFMLLLKSDGNGLYATKDLLLAQRKFDEFPIEKNLYLVDERQTHHFKQVFATLRKLGFEHANDCYHLAYNFVELPDGAMSSRKGNIVPLQELVARMEQTIKDRYLTKHIGAWSQSEVDSTARLVAQAAIKFGMNQVEPNTKIVFDMDTWLRLDGDSGPYVQYSCARLRSVVRKSGIERSDLDGADANLLVLPQERALMALMNQLNDVVVRTVETMRTNLLCDFLIRLARSSNAYYANEKIISEDQQDLSKARLKLCVAAERTLSTGLSLLGIQAPERM